MDDNGTDTHSTGIESPLLINFVDGVVDYRGRPVLRSKSGCWRSAYFIIAVEVAERFAYYGVSSNLITYLTGPLGQSTATAAENVNTWAGTARLLPLLAAFIADAFLGRYLMIIIASLLYVLALGFLALSTFIPSNCETANGGSSCSSQLQVVMFFISLYLVAIAQGGHKPCVQAFGADQFDADDPVERKAKSSFFNWWYFGMCAGPTVGIFVLSYIQDNLSWVLGFGIPCIIMAFALIVFLIGTINYRFAARIEEKSAFLRIGHVFVKAARNWKTAPSVMSSDEEAFGIFDHQRSKQFRFLDRALFKGSNEDGTVCNIDEVEEAKAILRLVPIWVNRVKFQDSSRHTTIFHRKPSGITMLQRIGIGILISIVSMVVAAVVETKRLETAREYGLIDDPNATIPMKIWWLLPQYLLAGAGDVFTMVGIQEFFYDQVPSDLKSMGLALYLSIIGIGSFLSSFLISIVGKMTGGNGEDGWISDNVNRGHIDYFYYLLAGISVVAFMMYIYVARSYVYYRERGL
ncbi:unnamed protein product [Lactuca saligna]|uniref:Uncharacterized protein n=1 Tax=Lactuca saligna TaxID=75948 RepID=A0AA35V929_LACSI|nr:unnamed protein product [Lactuca saligna]